MDFKSKIIDKYLDNNVWDLICQVEKLPESFIREYQDKLDWDSISKFQTLSEAFIREYADIVNWIEISYFQELSESFIREFQDKVYWDYISLGQTLSESFLIEFADKIDWYAISGNYNFSIKFIEEYENRIIIKNLLYNQYSYNFESLIIKNELAFLNLNNQRPIILYDLTKHSPEFINFVKKLEKKNNTIILFEKELKIKEFQMRTCHWCPIARKWFHRSRFNWDRYLHYIECWRSNPRFSYVQRKLEREFEEYCLGLKSLKTK